MTWLLLALAVALQSPGYDLIIRNGRVIDGTGAPARDADVAIKDGKVVAIGSLSGARATTEIDARGLVVAPGFVDVHTHADDLHEQPQAEHFLRMGVTTIVAGNCGGSSLSFADALAKIEAARPALNRTRRATGCRSSRSRCASARRTISARRWR